MCFAPVHRRWLAWLAALAMALGALAPAVAQVVVASSGQSQWVEVCSAGGMVWVKTDGTTHGGDPVQGSDGGGAAMGLHCAWCCTHAGGLGLPPSLSLPSLVMAGAQALPPLRACPLPTGEWAGCQARAPPGVA